MIPATDDLIPLEKHGIVPYFSNRIQLSEILEWVLHQIGPADLMISTFSTSEDFIRRLHRLQRNGLVLSSTLFCDLRAARKTMVLYHLIKSVFSAVNLCENHSKVVLLSNDSHKVAVITSQNQTRGDRFEAGVITNDLSTFYQLRLGFDAMAEKSLPLDSLIHSGTDRQDSGTGS